ncbi:MAG: matrixin family metalloprotease [Phycisphaerales bacterium]|nr:matrixin family metalloprotease [Phycisphaerales bacterium]
MMKPLAPAVLFAAAAASYGATPAHTLATAALHNEAGRIVARNPVLAAAPSSDLWAGSWIAMCFAPGTDEGYMEQVYRWILTQSGIDPDERYYADASWNAGVNAVGTPTSRTYSFPADTLGGIGGGATSQNVLNARFTAWFGSVAEGQAKVRQVFDRWQQLARVTFTQVNDDNASWGSGGTSNRGDIRIVSINIDGPGGTLAFNFFPTNGDMVLDSSENYQSATNDFRFFRNVVAHENGHGMGLAHSCPQNGTKLMEPAANTNFDGPRLDDIRGMQRLYGDNLESNDTVGTASNIGQVGAGFVLADRSIDNGVGNFFPADVDFYRFTVPTAGTLNISLIVNHVSPYTNAPQGGGCPTGTSVDPRAILDLGFELRDSTGLNVLHTANSGGLGQNESLTGYAIAQGGTYHLRIFTNDGLSDIQVYRLEMGFQGEGCPGDTNGDNTVDFSDLNIVIFQFNQSGPSLIGDVNNDGIVDFSDLNLVLSNYNQSC